MGSTKELVVKLIADASGYDKGTKRAIEDNEKVKKSSSGLGDGFIKGAGAALGFIGTAVGISSVGDIISSVTDYMKGAVQGAMDMQTAQAETNRILQSGTHVAGLTTKAVDDLSNSLMQQTGVDDDVVRGAENILAGYSNISLKAYPGVTAAALDMARAQSLATGTTFDANAAAQVLGLALQDPQKGMRLLRQYGIALSQAQQDQIKTFLKHGEVAKADGVILDAVKAKVGGASAAYKNTAAGGMMAFTTALENIQKTIGMALLPILNQMLQAVLPLAQQFAANLPGALATLQASIGPVVKGFQDFAASLLQNKPLMDGIKNALQQLQPFLGPVVAILGVLAAISFAPLALLIGIIVGIVVVLKKLWEITEPVRTAIGNLIGKAVELHNQLVSALQPAIHNVSEKLAELHSWFNDKVLPVIRQVYAYFKANILPVLQQVGSWVREKIVASLQNMWSVISNRVLPILGTLGGLLKNGVSVAFQAFGNGLGIVFGKIGDLLGMLGRLRDTFNSLHLQLPHINLPHFSITGSLSINPPSVPHLDIKWYAGGGIFTAPSIIGVGEAGPEAVVPLNRLGSMGGGNGNGGTGASGQPVILNIDGRAMARALLPHIVNEIRTSAGIRSN